MQLPPRLDLAFPPQRTLVVTGGGRGIGRAVARTAGRCGLRVAVWDLDGDAADAVVAELAADGVDAVAARADAADPAAVARALQATCDRWGAPPAYLVCNGGPPAGTPLTVPDGVATIAACVSVPVDAFVAAGPPDGAAIVNVASIAGTFVASGSDWYSAGKAAMVGLTRTLAARLGPGVRVNAVAPGVTRTARTEHILAGAGGADLARRCPLGRPGEPEETAGVIVFLCSPLAAYVTGAVVPVDGGLILHQ